LLNNCDYRSENIHILTEKSDISPTKDNIISQIKWLVSDNLKGDTLFFYYSGHGTNIRDINKDETDKKDEQIVPLDADVSGEIIDDWLYANLACNVPSGVNLWCFFDSCFSGTVLDLTYNCNSKCKLKNGKVKNTTTYVSSDWVEKFSISQENTKATIGNVCEFSGCLDKETSEDAFVDNTYQGAFTNCLIKFLNNHLIKMSDGNIRFASGTVKLKDMLKEINCLLDINKYKQQSQLSVGILSDLDRTFDI
jgi:hypothetical protein